MTAIKTEMIAWPEFLQLFLKDLSTSLSFSADIALTNTVEVERCLAWDKTLRAQTRQPGAGSERWEIRL